MGRTRPGPLTRSAEALALGLVPRWGEGVPVRALAQWAGALAVLGLALALVLRFI